MHAFFANASINEELVSTFNFNDYISNRTSWVTRLKLCVTCRPVCYNAELKLYGLTTSVFFVTLKTKLGSQNKRLQRRDYVVTWSSQKPPCFQMEFYWWVDFKEDKRLPASYWLCNAQVWQLCKDCSSSANMQKRKCDPSDTIYCNHKSSFTEMLTPLSAGTLQLS